MTHTDQIRNQVKKFEAALTTMAWGIASRVIEEQKKRLVSNLVKTNARKEINIKDVVRAAHADGLQVKFKFDNNTRIPSPSRISWAVSRLESKKGTWNRGSGDYKVIGRGKEPDTFDLRNVVTGKKINATLRTLAFRWRHVP